MYRATERLQSTDKSRGACWDLNTWSTSKLVRGRVFDLWKTAWFVKSWLETNPCLHTLKHVHTQARTHKHVKDILLISAPLNIPCHRRQENVACPDFIDKENSYSYSIFNNGWQKERPPITPDTIFSNSILYFHTKVFISVLSLMP